MRVHCPACEAAYEVPDPVIRSGRTLRCARCGHDWSPHPPADAPTTALAVPPEIAAPSPVAAAVELRPVPALMVEPATLADRKMPPPPLQPGPAKAGVLLIAAWVVSAAVLMVAIWAMWHFRAPIMQAWPASARLYAVFGA